MDGKQAKRTALLWLLVLVAVVFLWWFLRPKDDAGTTAAQLEADRIAALGADPDEIIVDLRDDASAAAVAALEQRFGLDLVLISDQADDEQVYRAKVDPARRDWVLAALAKTAGVEVAEPDATFALSPTEVAAAAIAPPSATWAGFPDDPLYGKQWHLRQLGMPEAWKLADGGGVIVAVLDTGVAYEDHGRYHQVEDLRGLEFVKPYDFVDNDSHANDDHGHGTHVTGTIAQATHNGKGVAGVARNVRIMPLKVLGGNGSGSVAGIADAIRYAADNGAKVINMSLGGPFPSRVLKKAVQYAHDKGVVVVCAAGNESRNKVGYPAAYPGAIAVASTRGDEATAFYSNYGKDIDVAAPGGDTRNGDGGGVLQNTIKIGDPTSSGYYAFQGTSMASPHVAGVAALIVGEGVTNPKMVEQLLKDTARKPKGQQYSADRYGAGIVDAPAAVKAARSKGGAYQFGLGLLLAAAVAGSARRRGLGTKLGAGYLGGVLFGAGGLFFLPWLAPSVSSWFGVEMLTRGLPSYDLALLGPLAHGNPLFMSALLPLAAIALGAGSPRLRPIVAGLAVGVAAHLAYFAAVPVFDLRYVPGVTLETLWLLGNAALASMLAVLTLKR
ncbi:MAG: peptidase S8 [Kofleriaceae bacterium]|nr:peptidase S8 [Kofleriaceae bacterium]MBP9167338.1 peptidase S8 [Kofleriaceae bacterium]MBP9859887.1 peptidase S8 [Kofleriaceae bacterium]